MFSLSRLLVLLVGFRAEDDLGEVFDLACEDCLVDFLKPVFTEWDALGIDLTEVSWKLALALSLLVLVELLEALNEVADVDVNKLLLHCKGQNLWAVLVRCLVELLA